MDDAINSIPDEAWPLIDLLFNATMLFTAIWLAWTVFVLWRRNASNLTSISDATPNRKATPDFLSVDDKARKEAIKRGDSFEQEIDKRDREEARRLKNAGKGKETSLGRLARLVSFGMALFSIATMISGTMFQVSIMGRYWEQYSATERLASVVQNHPVGVSVTVLVIIYNLFNFITNFKTKGV